MRGRTVFEPWIDWTSRSLARGVDDLFRSTALNPPKLLRLRSSAESLGHDERMRALATIHAFYGSEAHMRLEGSFFPQPEPASPQVTLRRKFGSDGEVLDLTWPSAFEPLWSTEAVERELSRADTSDARVPLHSEVRELRVDRRGELGEKYLRAKRNQTCHARWYRHRDGGRPCAVILHGYMAGSFAVEERVWAVRELFRAGLDVVISVLPFHGPRRSEARGYLPPSFPSSDPRFTIEGFRQLVCDQRALFGYLRGQGVPQIGLMGMSLGGYAAALLATLEPDFAFLVLFIPLASIEDFAMKHGRLTGTPAQQAEQYEALRSAQRVISPLSRAPRIDKERVLVLEGGADTVTGRAHAERLAQHFQAQTVIFPGGHLLQLGRGRAFEAIHALLRRQGLTRAPAGA